MFTFRKLIPPLKIVQAGLQNAKCLNTTVSKCDDLVPAFSCLTLNKHNINVIDNTKVTFSPRSIINITPNISSIKAPIMDLPLLPFTPQPQNKNIIRIEDKPALDNSLECPTDRNQPEKQAVRLIVIRRRKMRKHKLKKLRKRMKFEWARRKQHRELKREKMFQAVLVNQIKEAEQFSAEKYVTDKFKEAYDVHVPCFWKGKRLPRFIVRQLMGLDPKINYKGF